MVLEGQSGYGKTQGVLALLKEYNPKLIKEINSLRDYDPTVHKALVFDDIDLGGVGVEQLKHIMDTEVTAQIRVLYKVVEIQAGVRRAIMTNN